MATFEGTPLPSSFLSPNDLLQTQAFRYGPQTYADAHQNALLGQQEFGLREREFGLKQQEFDARRAYDDFGGVPGAATGPAAQGGGGGTTGRSSTYAGGIAGFESGGAADPGDNPLWPSARGGPAGQHGFIASTWNSFAAANPDLFKGMSPEQILAARKDPALSEQATNWYAGQNAKVLTAANIPATPANLGIAHALGGGGATKVLSAPDNTPLSQLIPETIAQNPQYGRMTVADLKQKYAKLGPIGGQPTQTAAAAPTAPGAPAAPAAPNPVEMTAVSDAARTLMAMPEAQRAAAYGPVVQRLQAQGFARNAPAQYPGHDVVEKLAGGAAAPVTGPQTDQAWLDNQAATYPSLAGPNVNQQAGTQPPVEPAVPAPYQIAGAPVGPPTAPAGPQRETFVLGADGKPQKALIATNGQGPAVPVNDLTPPPPAAVVAPPAPPPAAPPSTAVAALPLLNDRGLNAQQVEQLRRMRAAGVPTAAAEIAFTTHNDELKQQHFEQLRQAEKDAHTARVEAGTEAERTYQHGRNAVSDKAAADKAAREADTAAKAFQGTGMDQQVQSVLDAGDDGSAKYARMFSIAAAPRYNADGSFVKPNMTAYDKPTYIPKGMTEAPDYTKQEQPVPTIMNAEQSKNASFADRARESLPVITDTSEAAMSRWQVLLGKAPLGNSFVSPEFQLHQQSERDFINATLRRESGAAIAESEFANARQQYIPQPGDQPPVLAQKARNRETLMAGMVRDAGPAYHPKPADAPAASGGWTVKRLD